MAFSTKAWFRNKLPLAEIVPLEGALFDSVVTSAGFALCTQDHHQK
jgi:hypothetical protein